MWQSALSRPRRETGSVTHRWTLLSVWFNCICVSLYGSLTVNLTCLLFFARLALEKGYPWTLVQPPPLRRFHVYFVCSPSLLICYLMGKRIPVESVKRLWFRFCFVLLSGKFGVQGTEGAEQGGFPESSVVDDHRLHLCPHHRRHSNCIGCVCR